MTIGDLPPVRIPLTQGKYALIDAEDYRRISIHKWSFNGKYAKRSRKKEDGNGPSTIYMHREVFSVDHCSRDVQVDHISRNKLDNRFENLRICSNSENHANVGLHPCNTSGFKGVYFDKRLGKWRARIRRRVEGDIHIGSFDSPEGAAAAYDEEATRVFGEFAITNAKIAQDGVR